MEQVITEELLKGFEEYLWMEEKSSNTVNKYMRDVRKLTDYANGRAIDKKLVIEYKESLLRNGQYKAKSANSFLVAINQFFAYVKWHEVRVKTYKVQQDSFCPEERYITLQEYRRLLKAAKEIGDLQLVLILETVCGTGIRISELEYITVENVKKGVAEIHCKGKNRVILLPDKLQKSLLLFSAERKIEKGPIFLGRGEKPIHRSTVWRKMKAVSKEANVDEGKVFPHNFRHLFATKFYRLYKDIAKLADILGHSTIETTRIYIRTTWKEHRRNLGKMDLVYDLAEL